MKRRVFICANGHTMTSEAEDVIKCEVCNTSGLLEIVTDKEYEPQINDTVVCKGTAFSKAGEVGTIVSVTKVLYAIKLTRLRYGIPRLYNYEALMSKDQFLVVKGKV